MSSISNSLDNVISKLDSMTSEIVPKDYGEDIASKIDHVSKQLDFVTSGGGGGSSSDMFFVVHNVDTTSSDDQLDKTGQEIVDAFNAGKIIIMVLSTDDGADFDEIKTDFGKMVSITDDSMQIEGVNVSYSYTTDTYGLSSYPKLS